MYAYIHAVLSGEVLVELPLWPRPFSLLIGRQHVSLRLASFGVHDLETHPGQTLFLTLQGCSAPKPPCVR